MTGPAIQNPMAQLLPLLQFMQQIQAQRSQQADAGIARLPQGGAGMTVQQSGLTPQQIKAKFGRELNPGDMIAPDSPEARTSAMLLSHINAMSPDEVDSYTSSLLSKTMGVPQVTTRKGLASQAQSATTEAATGAVNAGTKLATANTVHNTVLKGLAEIEAAPASVQAGIGQKAAGLQGPDEEVASSLKTQIDSETRRLALNVLADPKHPLNQVMKENLGFNAITAASANGLGLTTLMDNVGQIAFAKMQGNKALEVAKFQAMLDEDKDLNKAEAGWAEDVAKNLGGTVSPRTVLNWKRWKESGGSPGDMPRGVTSSLDTNLSAATAVSEKAFITTQAEKGDSYAKAFLDIAQMGSKTSNSNTAQALSQLMGAYYAKSMTAAKYGPRPVDPQGQAQWDAAAMAIQAKMPKLESKWWITGGGVDANIPKGPVLPNAAPSSSNGSPPGTLNIGGKAIPLPPVTKPEDIQGLQTLIQALQTVGKLPVQLTPATPPQ